MIFEGKEYCTFNDVVITIVVWVSSSSLHISQVEREREVVRANEINLAILL
jgi:hypothetical protein